MTTAAAVWQEVLHAVKPQVTKPNYSTWLEPLQAVALEGDTLMLRGTEFAAEWVQSRLQPLVDRTLVQIIGPKAQIRFLHEDDDEVEAQSGSDPHHHLHRHEARAREEALVEQLSFWEVLDIPDMLKRHGEERIERAVQYVLSRRDVRNRGAYVRVLLKDEEIPDPIRWGRVAA